MPGALNPYSPPQTDQVAVSPKSRQTKSRRSQCRTYGILSISFGAITLVLALAWIEVMTLERRITDTFASPAPGGLMATMAKGIVETPPTLRYLLWVMKTIFLVGLVGLGVVQIGRARRALWPTRTWSIAALALLITQLGLQIALDIHKPLALILPLLVLAPYPVLLLFAFTQKNSCS
jgi:hypothetical protein